MLAGLLGRRPRAFEPTLASLEKHHSKLKALNKGDGFTIETMSTLAPECLDALLLEDASAPAEAVTKVRRAALPILKLFCDSEFDASDLGDCGVLEALAKFHTLKHPPPASEDELECLRLLCVAAGNDADVGARAGVLELGLAASASGMSDEFIELGVELINNCINEETATKVYETPVVVERLIEIALGIAQADVRESALIALSDLASNNKEACARVMGNASLFDVKKIGAKLLYDVFLVNLSNAPTTALELLERHDGIVESLRDERVTNKDSACWLLYNLSRHNIDKIRSLLLKKTWIFPRVLEFSTKLSGNRRLEAVLALVHLSSGDETKAHHLKVNEETLQGVMGMFRDLFDNDESKTEIWGLDEPLSALRELVVVRESRESFLKANVLISLAEALQMALREADTQSVELALAVYLEFASHEDEGVLERLQRDAKLRKGLEETLQLVNDAKWRGAHRAALTLNRRLLGEDQGPASEEKGSGATTQLAITYAAEDEESRRVAQRVASRLRARPGVKVWLDQDAEEAHDSSTTSLHELNLEKIAAANVVLVLVTHAYYASVDCKDQLVLARNHRKRLVPLLVQENYEDFGLKGWLGGMLGGLIYYKVGYGAESLDAQIDNMYEAEFNRERRPSLALQALAQRPAPSAPEDAEKLVRRIEALESSEADLKAKLSAANQRVEGLERRLEDMLRSLESGER